MEPIGSSNPGFRNVGAAEVEDFKNSVDEISSKVNTVSLIPSN